MAEVNSDGRQKMALTIDALKSDEKYIVRVRARNSNGVSGWSKGHQGLFRTLK